MKGADFPGLAATAPAAANGTHRPAKTNGAASKRAAGRSAGGDAPSAPEPLASPLATPEAVPVDVSMWCLLPAGWFQPELAPSAPGWSDLAIERSNRIPAPDFLHSAFELFDLPNSLNHSHDPHPACARPEIPRSGATPLGWEPRAVCRKEEHE